MDPKMVMIDSCVEEQDNKTQKKIKSNTPLIYWATIWKRKKIYIKNKIIS